ncbi:MAG: pteridine reductase [Gammaproteobacteria bacterium]|nr:pteridine reductase [Gammaproteobacteria bacterium]MBS04468.1 pteridine reductase [Gammaproteobacteria bacterium]|tara:strand:- start:1587 stop:2321 length:735 start_codon:yes stop_codon:yes gene_type:complete
MRNKVVLVTGGAQRIGAQVCRTFHEAGFNVIVHYRNSATDAKSLSEELNGYRRDSARAVQADLLAGEYKAFADTCRDAWGRLDCLVNNASEFYPNDLPGATQEQWDTLVGINLKVPFFLSQALHPALRESAGSIVNVTDIYANKPLHGYSIYCIAKAGLSMLTQSMAKEFAPDVRVNAIAPGAILWPGNEAAMSEETKAAIIRQTPMKRQGAPEDVASTALFLVRDAPYITGQVFNVDGGRSIA